MKTELPETNPEDCRPIARALARRYSPYDLDLREDLEQEAMLDWWRRLPHYRPESVKLSTYAYGVMKGACLHYLRAQRGKPTCQGGNDRQGDLRESELPGSRFPERGMGRVQLPCLLWDVQVRMRGRPAVERAIVARCLIRGETAQVVADSLGVSPQAVWRHKQAIVSRLRKLLTEEAHIA